jgi:hypothetical protein
MWKWAWIKTSPTALECAPVEPTTPSQITLVSWGRTADDEVEEAARQIIAEWAPALPGIHTPGGFGVIAMEKDLKHLALLIERALRLREV